jgi:hypothetical protein
VSPPQEIHVLAPNDEQCIELSFRIHPESDIVTDLYSDSTLIANMDESDCRISFNLLNKSVTSLSAVMGELGSPLGPHTESDLVTNLY